MEGEEKKTKTNFTVLSFIIIIICLFARDKRLTIQWEGEITAWNVLLLLVC